MAAPEHRLSWRAAGALVAVVYVAATPSVLLAPDAADVATFWPASGFAVIVLALGSPRQWPVLGLAIAAAVFAANLTGGRPADLSLLYALANVAAAFAATAVLTSGGRREARLLESQDFLRLLGASIVGGLVIAAGVALSVTVAGDGAVLVPARAVFATHAAAILILVPVALARQTRWAGKHWELGVQVGLLIVASVVVFAANDNPALPFSPVILLVWAALRFDLRVAAGELAALGVFVTAQTAAGDGPFGDAASSGSLDVLTAGALAQGYLIVMAMLTLPLGIVVQHGATLVEKIRTDEQIFRRTFTSSLMGMAFLRLRTGAEDDVPELVIDELNDTAVAVLGGDRTALIGRRFLDLVSVEGDFTLVLEKILRGTLDGWRADCSLASPRIGRVKLAVSLVSDMGDDALFAVHLLDVTTEHETRRALEIAEQLTSATLDTAACIILVTDLEGTVVRVNAATTDITGFAAKELLGRKVWESGITPSDAKDVEALFMWPNRSGVPVVRERDAMTRSGSRLRVVWNTNIVRSEQGEPMYAVMTGIDVTAERTTAGLVSHLMDASFTTALVGVDTRGMITVLNSGAQHMLGYDGDELVGHPFHRLLQPAELLERTGADTPDEAFEILVRGLGSDGETRARDWTWLTKKGTEQLVAMTVSVAQDAFAAQSGYLVVARDVTEQRESQEMLMAALDKERTAVEQLRSLDQAKNEFVSTVSHELRTPVTSIVGYTEMLQDGTMVDPLPDQVPLLDTIHRNGQRLISMITDLLMLSGLDSVDVSFRREPVDLAELLRPVEEAIRPMLTGRHLDLVVVQPPSAVTVSGDRAQLERVAMNLLSNAVKFTEDGGTIRVAVAVEGDQAVMKVSDSGIGIPVDEQGELFQRFFRSSTAQSKQIQGTGLGLSIVSAIVEVHGGTIDVESGHLAGTTFTVRLPLAQSQRLTAAG